MYIISHVHHPYINSTIQVCQELWSLGLALHMYEAEAADGVVWCVFLSLYICIYIYRHPICIHTD